MRSLSRLALLATCLGACATAHAQAAPPAVDDVSLSISPFHLFLPVLELTGELRATDLVGVALIGAVGSVSAKASTGETLHFDVLELGSQLLFYPLDAFESLQLGAELLYLHMNIEDTIGNERVSGLGAGIAVGPLAGYKWISDEGFTLLAQLGVAYLAVQAEAKNDLGERASESETRVTVLLNLNAGWSF